MPRTRHDVDRGEKVDQILELAERQMVAGGYAGLSVSGLARELGVAQNAIYWYFPSKDHVFVAVLERILWRELGAGKRMSDRSHEDRILFVIDRLGRLDSLFAAVHERARSSEVVGTFERNAHDGLRKILLKLLESHVAPDELEVGVDAFLAMVEGTFLHRTSRRRRRELVRFALARLEG